MISIFTLAYLDYLEEEAMGGQSFLDLRVEELEFKIAEIERRVDRIYRRQKYGEGRDSDIGHQGHSQPIEPIEEFLLRIPREQRKGES